MTLFVGVLDLPTGRLHYCNAGHDAPLLVGAGVGELRCDANIPVGFMPQWKYTLQEAHIFTGTTIFLFTDGLTEAEDINHAQFQMERVHEVAGQALAQQMQEPKELIGSMAEAVHQFVGDAEQSDDLTMMAIQYIKQQHDVKLRKSIVLPNDVEEVSKLTAFVEEVCETMGFDGALTAQLTLAIEEAVVNVMKYAYPPQKRGDVTIEAQSNDLRLKFTIIDSGMPFDPTVRAEVDTTLSAEDRPIGGLGIHLVRKIMDSINYERVDSLNVLTLRKKLNNNQTVNKKNEMETIIQKQDVNMVAILKGRLDTAAAPDTEKAMGELINGTEKEIILDCTELEYISSAGLRIFLTILQNTQEKGGHVYIKGISDDVRAVFALTGFINIFEFI